ncbi:type IV-A pilus assembly ATPase PilB [Phycisphaerae bacterium]|jgi:type IV pilus assembly protein PilB|nr:type IV-A pilus assembly ATPase PilB [Phycisphaerae bacterium]
MAKYNIDDILSELGVSSDKDTSNKNASANVKKHRIDENENSFSPLPTMPANQRAYGQQPDAPSTETSITKRGSSAPGVGPAMAEIYRPDESEDPDKLRELGELLLSRNVVTPDKLSQANQIIKSSPGRRLSEIILEQGADETQVMQALAQVSHLTFEHIDTTKGLDGGFDGKMLQRLTPEFCKQNQVIPLRQDGSRVVVAITQPDNVFLIDTVKEKLGCSGIKIVLTTASDIRAAIDLVGGPVQQEVGVGEILAEVQEGDVQVEEKKEADEASLEKEAKESPVIRYVNHIIQLGLQQGASDIHIEPSEKKLKVRFRIDGELYEVLNPPVSMGPAITSRIKIMANLAIDERRIPQDGRIRAMVSGRKIDLRVSTLPCSGGEKTVMRILNDKNISVDLEQLGFDEDALTIWKKQIDAPHGIVLVTGPTGSGKTTTLYASLRALDKGSMNISTVEDPVEYTLEGVTQTQMHEKIGMTFSLALRSLLRQDPDVILLGEIRDHETAHIAVQAALTGHLVLSTLHTNDAPSSITRLVNIGLEPFLVGAAVNGVLAQRLIRRLCKECKATEVPSEEMAEFLSMQGLPNDSIWASRGCDKCRKTGYSGRVGIYEMLVIDDALRDVIARNPNVAEFRRLCIERGMVTLRQDGLRKVANGLTTVSEVLRVTEGAH